MNTHKVKRHRNSDNKTGNREPQQNYRLVTVSNELLGVLKLVLKTYLLYFVPKIPTIHSAYLRAEPMQHNQGHLSLHATWVRR